jgi:hypothetical protein
MLVANYLTCRNSWYTCTGRMSTDWKRHFTRREGGSLPIPFSDRTGYHFSIRYRDVTSCTGILTLPTRTEQQAVLSFILYRRRHEVMERQIRSVINSIHLNLAEKLTLWYYQIGRTLQFPNWSQHKLIHVHITYGQKFTAIYSLISICDIWVPTCQEGSNQIVLESLTQESTIMGGYKTGEFREARRSGKDQSSLLFRQRNYHKITSTGYRYLSLQTPITMLGKYSSVSHTKTVFMWSENFTSRHSASHTATKNIQNNKQN